MTITPTPAAAPMTTVHGFAIQVLAFIPIPKDDLKRQIEVSQALIDLADGKKTVADLVPFMKGIEVRQQHVGKRVTVAEADGWKAQKQLPLDGGGQKQEGGETDNRTAEQIATDEANAKAAAEAAKPKGKAKSD